MHCEKLSTSQIGCYSIRNWALNTLCFYRLIGEIAIRKDFPLKFLYQKAFPWQSDKIKRKFLFAHRLLFYEYKMILAHRALNFFTRNAKQEINLTLPNFSWRKTFEFFNICSIESGCIISVNSYLLVGPGGSIAVVLFSWLKESFASPSFQFAVLRNSSGNMPTGIYCNRGPNILGLF